MKTIAILALAAALVLGVAATGSIATSAAQPSPTRERLSALEREVAYLREWNQGLTENLAYAELDAYRRDRLLVRCIRHDEHPVWQARCLDRVIR
jgi:broad specificity phosphatase PhoE